MIDRDDLPETPEWTPEPKPWDERACSKSCICETAQHAAFIHDGDLELGALIELGEN